MSRKGFDYTMNYKEALAYVDSLKKCGIVPGLTSITELCRRLGDPQKRLRFVHIAGTNGKGSVLAYVSTILKAAGYRTGRYISPVIFMYCEKIQINGRKISQGAMAEMLTWVREACDAMVADGLPQPTPFEVETAAAFLFFAENECEIVVLETGMGGREDATNLIGTTLAAVLAPISMDHMQFLGKTLGSIAAHKAGIIKNNCYVISAPQEPEAMAEIEKEAEEKGCSVTVAGEPARVKYGLEKQRFSYRDRYGTEYRDLEITLAGRCQPENAALAVEVIAALGQAGYPVTEKQLRKGLLATEWPGRFQIIGKRPLFVLDGAHNEAAAKKLADSVRFYFTNRRIIYIMGILKDKEYEKVVAQTYAYADQIITVTPPDNPRALPAYTLAQTVREYRPGVTTADSLEEAVEMAYLLAKPEDVILCFGSLSYLGRMTDIVKGRQKK